jgi:outer membrane receptor protein involved in Fe transport
MIIVAFGIDQSYCMWKLFYMKAFFITTLIVCSALCAAAQQPAKAQIRVIDSVTSQPLQNVTIQIPVLKRTFMTDASGTATITLPAGKYVFYFTAVGYTKTHTAITVTDTTMIDLAVKMKIKAGELSEVTVTGETEKQAEIKKIKSNVMPVTILTAKQIENKASNLNEILNRQAGVQVRLSGGLGSESRISVRGLEGKRVQIFIEGNPLNTPDGSLGINDLPLQIIERIEIYKGTVPAWLGGDGLGSAVNIVLRHRDVSYIDANVSYQSFNTRGAGLILKKVLNEQGIEMAMGIFDNASDNSYTMKSPYQPGLTIKRDHDRFHSLLTGGSIRFHKTWFDEVEVEGAYIKVNKQIQGIQSNIQQAENRSNSGVLALALKKDKFGNGKLGLRYNVVLTAFNVKLIDTSSWSYDWDGNKNPSLYGKGEFGIGPNGPNLSTTIQNEARHRFNIFYRLSNVFTLNLNNTFRYGKFNPHDDMANDYAGKNLFNYPGKVVNSTTGLTLESRLHDDRLLFSTAVKQYYNRVEGYNTNIYLQAPPEEIQNTVSTMGYNAGLRYNITGAFFIKASQERAIRLPVNSELFGDGALITPSISLKPEVAYNYTAGGVFDKFNKRDNHLQIEGNVFYMRVNKLIQLAGGGLTTGYVNYAKVNILGADMEVKSDITSYLFASVNATWQHLKDVNKYIPGTQNVSNPTYKLTIPNIPQLFGNWNLEFHKDNLTGKNSKTRIIYEGSYARKYNYGFNISVYDRFIIPSYHSHNLIIEQSFKNDRYVITVAVYNLTNEAILNNFNQPLPGRSFRIKLRYFLLSRKIAHTDHSHH